MAKVKSKTAGAGGKAVAKGAGKKASGSSKLARPVNASRTAKPPTNVLSKAEAPLATPVSTDIGENAGTPRAGSKLAIVLGMLRENSGASIDAIMQATGWLSHTTRAVLTGLKKRGFVIERQAGDEDSPSVYRIKVEATDGAAMSASRSTSKRAA